MSAILRDKSLADPEIVWLTISSLYAMAINPAYNHRSSEYAWYSIWTTIFTDLAAGMRARAPSDLHIFAPAPQFCLWAQSTPSPQSAVEHVELSASQPFPSPPTEPLSAESISAGRAQNRDKPSLISTNTQSTEAAAPRNFRLPDISMLLIASNFLQGREYDSLHQRDITKFVIPIILEIKPAAGINFIGIDEAQANVIDQAKYLFAAYEQNVVVGVAAVGIAFRYAVFRRKEGSASTASELLDPDYTEAPDNLKTSRAWCPMATFGKGNFVRTLKAIVRIAFKDVLDLPYDE